MLKSTHRLTTKQFMDVMKNGRIYTSPLFVMRALITNDAIHIGRLVSAVAPKKVAPTAVLRNQTRRRIYSAVRTTGILNNQAQSAHLIVCAKNETMKASQEEMEKDLVNLFKKAGLSV